MTVKITTPRMESLEKCPVCESKKTRFFFAAPDRLHGVPGEFRYHQCDTCKTVFQNPMVIAEDLYLCYPSDYFTHSSSHNNNRRISVAEALKAEKKAAGLSQLRHKIRLATINNIQGRKTTGVIGAIGKILSLSSRMREKAFFDHVNDELIPFANGTPKALEIGCGAGQTLSQLRQVGWDIEGVEWDEKAAEVARKNNEVPVYVGDFLSLELPENSYHLIFLHHVFEHFREPDKVLQKFSKLLVRGGRVVLVFPNMNSLGARLYKEFWFPWEVPRHLIISPIDAVGELANKFGLELFQKRTKSKEAATFSALSQRYKLNKPISSTQNVETTNKDNLLKLLEDIGVTIGLNWGEETLVILRKR